MRHHILLLLPTLAVLSTLTGCKKPPPSGDTPQASPDASAEVKAMPPLIAEAERFGLAARLPKDTPLFMGSVELGKHIDALKKSRYWTQAFAFIEDKTPAEPGMLPMTADDLAKSTIGDIAVAFGRDSGPAIRKLMELQALYSELTYYTMMAGGSASLMGGTPKTEDLMSDALAMPGLMDRVMELAKGLQVPTIFFGAKLENNGDLLSSLRQFLESSEELRSARVSTLTTPLGETLEIREWKADAWVTDDILNQALEGVAEEQRASIDSQFRELDKILSEKTLCLAFGTVSDHVIIALATDRSAIEFVSDPRESLLARDDLRAVAESSVDQNLAAIAVWTGSHLEQWIDRQPSKPILDGLLGGLKSSEMFGPMVDSIMPEITAFGVAEASFHDRDYDDGAAVFWWKDGLHGKTIGGASTREWILDQPLKFAPLLETPGLVFGIDGHGSSSEVGRAYFETAMAVIYGAARQALAAGLAGPNFGEMAKLVDTEVIPQIAEAYDASKTLYSKALGSESAYVVDLGGQMPMLWGMTEAPKNKPMLRLAAVHDVKNRALISTSWLRLETALSSAMKKIPSPIPLGGMSQPMESERFGITTYHQPPLFDSPDLLPCASLSDKLYILGTSKALNEELAFQLKENAGAPAPAGLRFRVNFKNVRRLAELAGSFSSEDTASTVDQSTRLWAAPFGTLDGTFTNEGGRVHGTIDWSIRDLSNID